jgi:2-oxoglutarate dehydrogenase E1 component
LSDLPEYTVGGCVHIIINNQIGFTTDPREARSSYHCTNVAKGVGAPIFHVNGDDVDAVVAVCQLAAQFRQVFHRDCVVDIVCFRRHGHNSLDDPSITQPQTYRRIQIHPTTLEIYERKLLQAGVLKQEQCDEMKVRCIR